MPNLDKKLKRFQPKNRRALNDSPFVKDRLFWTDVSDSLVVRLYEAWKHDFNYFGYDPNQYFQEIGIEKALVETG